METKLYNVRLNENEFRKLAELAERSGLGRAQVVRRLLAEAYESPQRVQFLRATGAGDD